MDSCDVLESGPSPSQLGSEEFLAGGQAIRLLATLQEASLAIDALWRSALSHGLTDSTFQLGEASTGVHRAIIALSSR